jgi:hypothetical protein
VIVRRFSIVNVEDFGFDSQVLGGLIDFGRAALRQRAAGDLPMADVAVGDRNEFDVMTQGGPFGRHAAGLVLGVVRMRAEANDPQLAIRAFGQGRAGTTQGQRAQRQNQRK